MKVSQKIKVELLHDPAITRLGIYCNETKTGSQRVIHTPKFIAALFTIAKIRKQAK